MAESAAVLIPPLGDQREGKPMRTVFTAGAILCFVTMPSLVRAAEPIATADGEAPGTGIEVRELKVGGGAVTLKFVLKNGSDKPIDIYHMMDASDGGSVDAIYLVDVPGKKKYLVVRDSDSHCLCSRKIPDSLKPNDSVALWAKFPAPPDSVQKIGVVVPHFTPMDDVPISH